MIKHLIKYRALVAAILVLAPLLFWFSYSELGLFTIEKENQSSFDYCEIVKVTKTESGESATSDLFKLKVDNSICLHCINEANKLYKSFNKLELEHFHTPQHTTEIYLYNRTFLI